MNKTKLRETLASPFVLVLAIAFAVWALGLLMLTSLTPVHAAELIPNGTDSIQLEVSKGRLVRLPAPAQTVFIADPEIADIQIKSPRLVYLLAKKPGQTTLFAVDAQERVLANMSVNVSHNLGLLRAAIRDVVPDRDISVTTVADSLLLTGTVANATDAENIRRLAERFSPEKGAVINRLSVEQPGQVNLRVRVAEISRDVEKQLGFNWSIAGSVGGLAIGLATQNPFAANVASQTLNLTAHPGSWDFNAVIDALEEEGLVTVLAEPNLTAVSGETASFLAGGEFPILVPDSNGRVTIEFKKFGVALAFTPTVSGGNRISLHVRPEVSQLSSTNAVVLNNFTVPSLTTRRADTTVELGSGQSFAIAGLLQNNVTHDLSKFPGLGDVPVLGALFKSDSFKRDESELVIIVTPYIVKPVSRKLAAPTDGYIAPHDLERLSVGGVNKRAAKKGPAPTVAAGGTLIGPVGFELD